MTELSDKVKAAVLCGNVGAAKKSIKELVDSGFEVDEVLPFNPRGFENNWSLVFWASLSNSEEVLRQVVGDYKAKVNVTDSCGYTPLHIAAFHSKFNSVKFLVEHGADINAKSNYGEGLEELVLRKPVDNDRDLELREYVQDLIRS